MSGQSAKYFVGVDIGNTKTVYALVHEDGTVLQKFRGPGANYQEIGAEEMTRRVREAMLLITQAAGISVTDISAIYYGAAGADTPADFEIMRPALAEATPGVAFEFDNDCWIALHSGTKGGPGMVVTCGTGNTNCAMNAVDEKMRIGGLEEMLGDVLGAFAIARYAVSAAMRSEDGRDEPTILTSMLPKAMDIASNADFITMDINSDRVVTIVQTFFEAARKGDGKSLEICWMLVKETLKIVREFYNGLFQGESFKLVLEGSVFKQKYEPFTKMLELALHQKYDVEIVFPEWDPVVGAIFLAFKSVGVSPESAIVNRIIKTYTTVEWLV